MHHTAPQGGTPTLRPRHPPAAVRRAERVAHHIRHPIQGLQYEARFHTTGRIKRLLHRAIDRACCSMQ
jgi:hypothetical protein